MAIGLALILALIFPLPHGLGLRASLRPPQTARRKPPAAKKRAPPKFSA